MTMTEQQTINAGRAQMAQEIVDGQASTDMTVEDWKRFAKSWIETAAQHAANESYFRDQRNAATLALADIVKLQPGEESLALGIAADALKDLHCEGESP